jgi:SAM-dependent methyltransferase
MAMKAPTECPLCGAVTPFPCVREHSEGGVNYELYGCRVYAIEFWWPLKNPGAEWYSHDARYADRNANPVWEAGLNQKKVISFLDPFKGKVLDVGCGIGNSLAYAVERGWEGIGIDFDADAIAAGKKRFGLTNLEVNDVVTYARIHADKKFDLITFFDVLEHVDNHNEFIEAISSLLVDGGYIAMSMPYRKHAEWLMPLDVPPRHLTRWDRTSLKKFLEARGFAVVYMTRRTDGIWNIIMRLRFKYGNKLSFGAVRAVRSTIKDTDIPRRKRPLVVRVVHALAKSKDTIFFGPPALIIWVAMLLSSSRYVTLYAIARKNS